MPSPQAPLLLSVIVPEKVSGVLFSKVMQPLSSMVAPAFCSVPNPPLLLRKTVSVKLAKSTFGVANSRRAVHFCLLLPISAVVFKERVAKARLAEIYEAVGWYSTILNLVARKSPQLKTRAVDRATLSIVTLLVAAVAMAMPETPLILCPLPLTVISTFSEMVVLPVQTQSPVNV